MRTEGETGQNVNKTAVIFGFTLRFATKTQVLH